MKNLCGGWNRDGEGQKAPERQHPHLLYEHSPKQVFRIRTRASCIC